MQIQTNAVRRSRWGQILIKHGEASSYSDAGDGTLPSLATATSSSIDNDVAAVTEWLVMETA